MSNENADRGEDLYGDPRLLSNLPPDEPSLVDTGKPDMSELQGIEVQEPATLENLVARGERRAEIVAEIAVYKEQVAELEDELKEIEEKHVPQILNQLKMKNFGMQDGTEIKLELSFQGSLVIKDKEQRMKQLAWLADPKTKGENIIKKEISLVFPRGKSKEADFCEKILKEFKFDYTVGESVHAGSLGSFIKAKVVNGDEVPFEELKWRVFDKAKFKDPKKDD